MKKLMTLFLAVLMIFSLSFASAEDTFAANLEAFLSSIDVAESDVLVNADMMGQQVDLQIGKDDAGVHGKVSMAGTAMGEAMITSDAAYLSAMGQGYKLQFATVTAFAQKMFQAQLGDVQISSEQLMADFQMLVMKAYPYLMDFATVLSTEEVENGTRFVVDSAALSEALTKAIDGILMDEEVAACLDRYLALLKATGTELHAADLQNAWNGNKEQFKELVAGSEISLTLYNDQKYDLQVLLTRGEEKAGILSNGFVNDRQFDSQTTIGVVGQEPAATIAITVDGGTVTYDMKTEEVHVYEQIVMDGDMIKSIDYVITDNGETAFELHYAGDHLSLKAADMTINADITVREAKRMEAVVTYVQGSSETVMNAVAELQDDALVLTLSVGDTPVVLTLTKTEKGTWNDLSKDESLVELNEEMLSMLLPVN